MTKGPSAAIVLMLPLAVMACGSNSVVLPSGPSPTPTVAAPTGSFPPAPVVGGPFVSQDRLSWFPGPVESIGIGQVVRSNVDPAGRCIRDPQHACRRFSIVPTQPGTLHVHVTFDAETIGFDPSRNGEVVIIALEGGWVASMKGSGGSFDKSAWINVAAGATYEVIPVAWEPTIIPIDLRSQLEPF